MAQHEFADLTAHRPLVVRALLDGRLVPLLGAGVNRCGRPDGVTWAGSRLPDGGELARHLADFSSYPVPEDQEVDLVRVSQYCELMLGLGPLYEELHSILNADYPLTPVHRILARVPGIRRSLGCDREQLLVITTNYDDALERAFDDVGEPYDLVTYVAVGPCAGSFMHASPDGGRRVIEQANEYVELSLRDRTLILKLHGAVDRADPASDSYVITEDDYIDYLAMTDLSCLLPVTVGAKLRRSHLLFLGYSLRDWNLRVILRRIWGDQALRYRSWAIQLGSQEIDRRFWSARGVDILEVELERYVAQIAEELVSETARAAQRADVG